METIVLLSCVSKKKAFRCKARDLYESTLFTLALKYAEKINPDRIFILSALYGVLELEDIIEPYDVTLNNMSEKEKVKWSDKVISQLTDKGINLNCNRFIILAGNNYRKHLVGFMKRVEIPLKGLRIGQQLSYLKKEVDNE